MVLKDDAFSSILAAIGHGRLIFNNIRKSVLFMMCTNIAEILAVGAASLIDLPLPLRALQILFLNVITDVFPALALCAGKGNPERVMKKAPRDPDEPVLRRQEWFSILAWSLLMAGVVIAALAMGSRWFGLTQRQAVTCSFLTLAFAKLWFVFNLRNRESGFLRNDITQNPWMWASLALCAFLLVLSVYLAPLAKVLGNQHPEKLGWLLAVGLSSLPMLLGQILIVTRSRMGRKEVSA